MTAAPPADPPAPSDEYDKPAVPWEQRPALLDTCVQHGWASHPRHAVNILRKLEAEGRADPRWTDAAAAVAVEMYRRANPRPDEPEAA